MFGVGDGGRDSFGFLGRRDFGRERESMVTSKLRGRVSASLEFVVKQGDER